MVARATRCDNCRLRKIKCNEQWPVCAACRKSKLKCSGAPRGPRFVYQYVDPEAGYARHADLDTKPLPPRPTKPYPVLERPIPKSGTCTASVAAELVYMMTASHPRYSLQYLGKYMHVIPAMMQGSDSPALQACIACCLDAQKRTFDPIAHDQKLDYRLYQRALRSLRKALNAPGGMKETSNLLATVIMHRLETLIATMPHQYRVAPCWSPHAGGVSALVQSFGPAGFKDDLLFSVFVENYHTIVSHAVVSGTECFLADPAWLDMLSSPCTSTSTSAFSPYEELHYQLLRHLPSFCRIFKLLGIARREASQQSLETVFHEALQLAQALKAMDPSIEAILLDGTTQLERVPNNNNNNNTTATTMTSTSTSQQQQQQPPVEFLYEASNLDLPRICCYHGYFSLVVGAVLEWLVEPPLESLRHYHRVLSKRIWAFHRQALKFGPLAFDFYTHALAMTYDQAESDETKEWVVALLNQVQRRHRSTDDMWTKDGVWLSDFVRTGSIGLSSSFSPGFFVELA